MLIFGAISRICDDTYCCSEQYRYDISLYLLSILDHEYNIIIDRTVGSLVHGRDVVDGINTIKILYTATFISHVKHV